MSAEAKRVKVLMLAELFLGMALVVLGIALLVMGAATASPALLCGEGVLTLFLGVRGALIVNVPARIPKLVTLGAIMLLLQLACVVGIVFLTGTDNIANDPVPVVAGAVPCLLTLIAVLMSRGIAKRAER